MKYVSYFFFCTLCFTMMVAQPARSIQPLKGIEGMKIECSLFDSEGFWWYGGKGSGLCRYDGYETESFRSNRLHPDLLRSNDLLCMVEHKGNA